MLKHCCDLIIAFPGTGKTTLVKACRNNPKGRRIIDLDLKGPREWKGAGCPKRLIDAQTAYVEAALKEGASVCTYAGAIAEKKYDCDRMIFVMPYESCKRAWLRRLKRRGDSREFLHYVEEHFDDLIASWKSTITGMYIAGNNVHVIRIEGEYRQYLTEVLEVFGDPITGLGNPEVVPHE